MGREPGTLPATPSRNPGRGWAHPRTERDRPPGLANSDIEPLPMLKEHVTSENRRDFFVASRKRLAAPDLELQPNEHEDRKPRTSEGEL